MFKIFSQTLVSSFIAMLSVTASQAYAHQDPELALLPPKPIQMTEVAVTSPNGSVRNLPFTEIIKKDLRWKDECDKGVADRDCFASLFAAQKVCIALGMRLPTIRELLYFNAPKGVTINACIDGQNFGTEVMGVDAGGTGSVDSICYRSEYKIVAGDQYLWSSTYNVTPGSRGRMIRERYVKYWAPDNGGAVRNTDPEGLKNSVMPFRCVQGGVGSPIYSY